MKSASSNYLWHQGAWIVAAIAMNLYSMARIQAGETPLTTTQPAVGITLFLLYTPVVVLAFRGWCRLHLWGSVIFLIPIIAGGILAHLAAALEPGGLSAYASTIWWAAAIGVNTYGVAVSILAIGQMRAIKASG